MKKNSPIIMVAVLFFTVGLVFAPVFAGEKQEPGYLLEQEKNIAATEAGPHKGGGNTTGYRFFQSAKNAKLQFTKRVLHPGSAIGYHLQKDEEIYYIVSGSGEMTMNGKTFLVQAGDCILTFAGSSHGLKQTGKDDLVVIINYEKK